MFLAAQSDLSGVQRALRRETRIDHATDAGQLSVRFGSAAIWPGNTRERILEWKLDVLGDPFHPEGRTIPVENLRVFVADPAREYLVEGGVEIVDFERDMVDANETNTRCIGVSYLM